MQYDDGGDHADFWGDDQPTRQLRRVQPGKRSHDHTGSIPVVAARQADATRPLRRAEPVRQSAQRTSPLRNMSMVDPLLRRIGMVVAAIVVLIPVAVALRSEPQAQLESVTAPTIADLDTSNATAAPAAAAPAAAPAPAINPADLPALTVPTTPAPSYYVAADLPPAVPSVTQPPAAEATAAADTASTAPAATATTTAIVAAAEGSGATCSKTYTVVSGDFWIGIAKRAQVTLKELLRANNAKSSTNLFPGRSICLPKNAVTPVPAAQPTAAPAPATTVKAATPKPAPAPAPAPATTVKPTPTTTPAAPAPKNNYTQAQVIQIIREVWPDDLEEEAIRIATRESRLTPNVRNYCCFGLFQIYFSVHKRWLADLGVTNAEMLYDPRVNANAALALYVRAGGWGPWKL